MGIKLSLYKFEGIGERFNIIFVMVEDVCIRDWSRVNVVNVLSSWVFECGVRVNFDGEINLWVVSDGVFDSIGK